MPQRSSLLLYAEVVLSFLSNGRHWAVKRRDFITMLGGAAAAAWPLTAAGAQTERMRRVGLLMHTTPDELDAQARLAAFLQGLQAAGWEVGRNLRLDTRWSSGDPARLRKNAAELVALNPDVLVAGTGPTLPALLQASRTVPIVFAQAVDPIGSGSIKSLARPGGNATGFLQFEYELSGKWLELLKEVAPQVKRVGVVRGFDTAGGVGQWAVIQAFSRAAVYPYRSSVTTGGLISYGPELVGQFRLAASYVDRILKGEKPADLPVQAPTKYELVVNLKTAKTLGLTVPPALLARADEVIE